MARFRSIALLALLTFLILSPLLVRPTTALIAAADDDAAGAGGGDVPLADEPTNAKAADGEDDDDLEDDEEAAAPGAGDADAGEEAAAPPAQPDKPAVIDPEGEENASGYSVPSVSAEFFDDFQSGLGKWVHSHQADYNGEFKLGQGAKPTFKGDRALIIPQKARKYGLSAAISGLDDLSGKPLVLQYELKLEEGMTCGGAYLKLPLKGFKPASFNGDTPYSVMFGPDKCGSTDKVHFIFQSENPKTGKRVEHHLKDPPAVANSYDKKTHLYTMIVKADGKFEVKVDGDVKKSGSLSDSFEPPVQPVKQIDDPEDKKPEDWIDEKKIADPDAKKPDDWDEDAPAQIPDTDAKKPDGWLDDEPEKIPDPEAKKPDAWDDEEDGDWKPKLIENPKCEKIGCGEWTAPLKTNPDYKGKWKAPMIDNPKYIGEWKPKKIDNPDYYDAGSPKLLGIAGVGLEIWTMDQGVLFDNVLLGTDLSAADKIMEATFGKKTAKETEEEKKEAKEAEKEESADKDPKTSLGPVMDRIELALDKLESLLEPVEVWLVKMGAEPYLDKMIDMGIKKPMLIVISVPLMLVLLFLILGGSRKKPATEETTAEKKKTDAETKDATESEITAETKDNESEAPSENIDTPQAEKSETLRRRPATAD